MKKNWINQILYMIKNKERDKYDQFPKRAVESEYNHDERTEEEPSVLSRQAKYKQKVLKN